MLCHGRQLWPLDGISLHRLDRELVMEQWDDILRVVGSLQMGRVKGAEIITVLSGGRKGSPRRNLRRRAKRKRAQHPSWSIEIARALLHRSSRACT
ncbi:MAG: Tn3 family transposase [Ktedonobacterales bacterium]